MRRVFDVHSHYPSGSVMGMDSRLGRPVDVSEAVRTKAVEAVAEQCALGGIEKICLLGGWGDMNDWVLDARSRFPDLIVPMAYLDLDSSNADTVSRYRDQGFSGVKCILPQKNYDDSSYMPIYEKLCDKNMPVLFHTGVFGGAEDYLERNPRSPSRGALALDGDLARIGSSSARMRAIYLDTIATALPGLRIIGAHLGYGEYDLACAVARWRRNVYFDLSGGDVVRRHIRSRGLIPTEVAPSKLMFGSDCVTSRIANEVKIWEKQLVETGIDDEEIDAIMYGNAAYVFGLDRSEE